MYQTHPKLYLSLHLFSSMLIYSELQCRTNHNWESLNSAVQLWLASSVPSWPERLFCWPLSIDTEHLRSTYSNTVQYRSSCFHLKPFFFPWSKNRLLRNIKKQRKLNEKSLGKDVNYIQNMNLTHYILANNVCNNIQRP